MSAAVPDRASLAATQLEALRAMIARLVPANPFYTRKLGDAEAPTSLDDFRRRTPFTTKQELIDDQRAHPPYGTDLTFPLARYTRFNQTSGTTGAPLRWLDTPESWSWMLDRWTQVLEASGIRPGDRVLFAFSFGPFLGFWTAFEAAARLGCLCLPGGGLSSVARLRVMRDNGVTALCCTPTYAIRLAEVAAEESVDLAAGRLHTIIAAGEPGASIPATRAHLEALWPGARIGDHHGMTETGPVTYECPERAGVLHVMEPHFIPEVIDPTTGEAQPPGSEGELVLTNLGRLGSPLIRYRTGDIVRAAAAAPCACGGHTLALEGGILGRTDDMLVIRGANVYPAAVEEVVRAFADVAEYRVAVRTGGALTELLLDLEPRPTCADPERMARDVEAALRAAFNLRVPVTLVAAGALPRFELKARRWVRVDAKEAPRA